VFQLSSKRRPTREERLAEKPSEMKTATLSPSQKTESQRGCQRLKNRELDSVTVELIDSQQTREVPSTKSLQFFSPERE